MNKNLILSGGLLLLLTLTGITHSVEQEISHNAPSANDLFTLKPYRANYFLPAHYSEKPDRAFFQPLNPNDREGKKIEIEFQISLFFDVWQGLFKENDTVRFAYTQNAYWQAYDKSAYFRDTDYQPELFYQLPMSRQWGDWQWQTTTAGFWHESNGKGGSYERSWNRVFVGFQVANGNFAINFKPWVRLKFSHDYNKDISHYRGHGEIEFLYQTENNQQFMAKSRNDIDSGFSRGYEELAWLFPITGNLRGFIKLTSGYGESISSYNHYDNTAGIGVALSGWQL
ncbi:phospholipase A [Parendozoicomonas haliclonae]|uniref:Phospholipase A1 n=1 Tax=Parendozoicomonas haliclonae TaxID=1960125 RepID=A0A1X7ARU7_9GAMM|nr:phospholipase A [Parendozoicomonas haliclonae]SMA50873.1 Phospholipase A1 precursor [Parendozoicomonas haliclonae]